MGFTALWVSFPVENVNRGYHGYWPLNLYNLNSGFGNENDLQQFVKTAHNNNMFVMSDVVVNHMGSVRGVGPVAHFHPFNKDEHYHDYCIIRNNSTREEIVNCRIGSDSKSLPDLHTEVPGVVDELKIWFTWYNNRIDWDGFRLDAVKHIRADFWAEFLTIVRKRLQDTELFAMGEVYEGDPAKISKYQDAMHVLNFPLYYTIQDVFGSRQSMKMLPDRIQQIRRYFKDTTTLGNFVDNHDVPRFANKNGDMSVLKNALLYVLGIEGIPIIYYGTEHQYRGGEDPQNREPLWYSNYDTSSELYKFLAGTNEFRNYAPDDFHENLHQSVFVDDQVHAFVRGTSLFVVTNQGSNANIGVSFSLTMESGTVLQNYFNPSERISFPVSEGKPVSQTVNIQVKNGQPKLFCSRKSCPHKFK
ncbi:glycoside hydrolase superfamily [Paraphysoderma sedebokerense]|nr:glycoside hydrolase superfamily [Paraphysoderma sedebokerense]